MNDIRKIEGWFNYNISCKLGSGSRVNLCRDYLLGSVSLQHVYPHLFDEIFVAASRSKVNSLGEWLEGVLTWNLNVTYDSLSVLAKSDFMDIS